MTLSLALTSGVDRTVQGLPADACPRLGQLTEFRRPHLARRGRLRRLDPASPGWSTMMDETTGGMVVLARSLG